MLKFLKQFNGQSSRRRREAPRFINVPYEDEAILNPHIFVPAHVKASENEIIRVHAFNRTHKVYKLVFYKFYLTFKIFISMVHN